MRRFLDCPACGAACSETVLVETPEARERFLAFSRRGFGGLMNCWLDEIALVVRRCRGCRHHWYEEQPEPEQLAAMYEALVPAHRGPPPRDPTPHMLDRMRRLHALASRLRANRTGRSSLLDYGSGRGRWARAAVAAGFDVVAFEPSRSRGAEEDAQGAGFDIVHDLDDIGARRFDAINLEQVLEHIPAATEALSGLLAWATPRTVLRIATPNVLRCPEGDKLYHTWPYDGTRAHTLAPFEHVNGFTPMSLARAAERGGWVGAPLRTVARVDPAHVLRRLASRVDPRIDQTLLYAVPARADNATDGSFDGSSSRLDLGPANPRHRHSARILGTDTRYGPRR